MRPITLDPTFSSLAWSPIFGPIASTALTLVVVPAAYRAMAVRSVSPGARAAEAAAHPAAR